MAPLEGIFRVVNFLCFIMSSFEGNDSLHLNGDTRGRYGRSLDFHDGACRAFLLNEFKSVDDGKQQNAVCQCITVKRMEV